MTIDKIFKRRMVWTSGVFSAEKMEDFFNDGAIKLEHHIAHKKFRFNKEFRSTCADPFIIQVNDLIYVFYDVQTDFGFGTIWVDRRNNDGSWECLGCVIKEKFHISYPQVFLWQDKYYMIPETGMANAIYLYEAENFPIKWNRKRVLVDAECYDPTLLIANNSFFILGTTPDNKLKLFKSNALCGPYKENLGFINNDLKFCRCGGSFFKIGDDVYRVSQDCSETYGRDVNFHNASISTEGLYFETQSTLKFLTQRPPWAANGLHTVNFTHFDGRCYAAIDGKNRDLLINTFLLALLKFGVLIRKKFKI